MIRRVTLAILALAGCAVAPPATWDIPFTSTPPGALVRLSTGQSCTTPCVLPVPADRDVTSSFYVMCPEGVRAYSIDMVIPARQTPDETPSHEHFAACGTN